MRPRRYGRLTRPKPIKLTPLGAIKPVEYFSEVAKVLPSKTGKGSYVVFFGSAPTIEVTEDVATVEGRINHV